MEYHRAQLKEAAKADLRSARIKPWKITLAFILLTAGLEAALSLFSLIPTLPLDAAETAAATLQSNPGLAFEILLSESGIGSFRGSFLGILFRLYTWVMALGYGAYALALARRQQAGHQLLFAGFGMVGRTLLLNILILLFTYLWALAVAVPVALLSLLGPVFAIFFAALAIVFVFSRVLRYQMAAFALLDDPSCGAAEAIRRSKALMKGRVWDFFVLQISFSGWYLLAALISAAASSLTHSILLATLAAAPLSLWLTPYFHCSKARFYNLLSGNTLPSPGQDPDPPFSWEDF